MPFFVEESRPWDIYCITYLLGEPNSAVTALLARWSGGDHEALNDLTPLIYENLRRIASRHLAHERPGFTLCATEVVHEAYQRLASADVSWQDRAHFLSIASRQMRQVLVDYARSKRRQKRGGEDWQRVTLTEVGESADAEPVNILSIQDALERLTGFDPRKAEIVDLMIFGGVTGKDIAEIIGISEDAVWREWRMARAWLRNELKSIHDA
jgi:RNA polymerase sigma-70 factor (ECF subfamily)